MLRVFDSQRRSNNALSETLSDSLVKLAFDMSLVESKLGNYLLGLLVGRKLFIAMGLELRTSYKND